MEPNPRVVLIKNRRSVSGQSSFLILPEQMKGIYACSNVCTEVRKEIGKIQYDAYRYVIQEDEPAFLLEDRFDGTRDTIQLEIETDCMWPEHHLCRDLEARFVGAEIIVLHRLGYNLGALGNLLSAMPDLKRIYV